MGKLCKCGSVSIMSTYGYLTEGLLYHSQSSLSVCCHGNHSAMVQHLHVHYITASDGMKAIGGSSAFLWNVKTVVRLGKHSMPSQGDNDFKTRITLHLNGKHYIPHCLCSHYCEVAAMAAIVPQPMYCS